MDKPQLEPGAGMYLNLMKQVLTASIYEESAWSVVESRKLDPPTRPLLYARGLLRELAITLLRKKSMVLVRQKPFDPEARERGKDWPFLGYTMIGPGRLSNVQACIEDVIANNVPGDLIEVGAWRGGTTMFMRAVLKAYDITDRKVWVADSFEGLPAPVTSDDGWDLSEVEILKVSLKKVKSNFERFGLLDDQVEFLQGWFRDTLPNAAIRKLAVLRLDGDLYSSTMDSLENLYSKVSKGGYVIVDDYYSWPACHRAVNDFLASNSIRNELVQIDWSGAYWQV